MKLLHVITKLNNMYGAQRHAVESIKNHLSKNHSCLVITGEVGIASRALEDIGVQVVLVGSLKNSYNPITGYKAIVETVEILQSFKPDLVISHSTIGGIIARVACYQKKIPNLFTVQGWPFEIGTSAHQRFIALVIERILKRYSDSYQCVSNYTAEYGIKTLNIKDASRIYVCGNMHVEKENTTTSSPFKIYNNILMVAGFRDQKDHLSAIRAFERIINSGKLNDLKLTFVGDGPKRKVIEDFIKKRQLTAHVVIVGETKDVDIYYSQSDIVILPTFYEGLPLSLIEAIQMGKPVIATDVGGIREIVHDNVNGNLIKIEDDESLANHILDYYTNGKLQELSIQSRRIYNQYYSYNKTSEQLNKIILKASQSSMFKRQQD